mmetsp:Transcript_18981/g.43850  ORF Transcript_18981/g.43850 Transcript_18981/m.43850 type:complete len:460 (-) Transcript_18981:90-1469(-)
MNSGHETLLQAKLIVDDLGKGSQTVGGARSVGDNVHAGFILLLVDSHDKHRGISGRSRDDNLLGTSDHVLGGSFSGGECSSGFNNVVNTSITPSNLGGVHFFKHTDDLSIDFNVVIVDTVDGSGVCSVCGIMLEHVFHVLGSNERIVDANNVDHRIVLGGAHDETSDTSKSIDTNVDRLQTVLRSLAVDNICEFGFEGGSTDQESIDIRLSRKSRSGCGVGGSTVKDAAVLGNIRSSNLGKVLTDGSMCVLSLFGCGGETSSDSPDGFVSDDNILPVFLGENIGVCLDLREDEVVGGSGFAVFQRFSAACEDLNSVVKSVLSLGSNLFVGFTLFATFGVANKSPLNPHVLQHIGAGFTSESSISLGPYILGSNSNVSAQVFLHTLNVNLRRAYNDFSIGGQSGLVEHRNKLLCLRHSTVALPVTADEEFTSVNLGGRVVGTSGHLRCRRDEGFGRLHLD